MAIERWRPFVSVERWDPFRNMSDIQGEVNRLFDSFLGRPTAASPASGVRMWAPVLDMHETKDDLVLNFELPGVREKDVSLSITGDLLTVRGERGFDRDTKDETTHHIERVYGKFERSVQLPMPGAGRQGEGDLPRRSARGQASESRGSEAEGNQDRHPLSRSRLTRGARRRSRGVRSVAFEIKRKGDSTWRR